MDNKKVIRFALLLAGALTPFAFLGSIGISVILCGALFAYFYVSDNMSYIFMGCGGIFAFVLVMFDFNFFIAAITALEVFLLSLFIGDGLKKRTSFGGVIIGGSTACLFANVLSVGFFAKQAGVAPVDMLFKIPLNIAINTFKAGGAAGQTYVDMLSLQSEKLIENFELLSPSYLILTAVLSTYITFAITRTAVEKKGGRILHLPYFYELKLPKGVTMVFLVMFVFILLFNGSSAIILNIITVILAILTVCGVSVLDYYLKKYSFYGFFRLLIYTGIFIFSAFTRMGSYLTGILFATGVIDSFAGLRK